MKWLFMSVHLILLHGPNNHHFEINADEISSIRAPQAAGHLPKGTHCLITMTNGKFNAVQETCEAVDRLIQQLK